MLNVGQKFNAAVRDLASDGRGVVVHPTGRTFFVAGVWLEERGEFRITGLKGRIGFAEVIRLEQESLHPLRIEPKCSHHGFSHKHCGGCPWQFMAYEAQLSVKQSRVEQAMARLDCESKVLPILAADNTFGYRNRAQFKTDGERLGYMAASSNQLVAINSCPVLTEKNQNTFMALTNLLPNSQWRSKGRHKGRPKWVSLDIDESVNADTVSVNQRLPFQQGNSQQNRVIRHWLADVLKGCVNAKTVLELFCGSGNLTDVIAASGAAKTYAVEVVDTALSELKQKGLANVQVFACDLFSESDAEKLLPLVKEAEVLVLDPPRDGLKVVGPLFVKKSKIRKVVYISCDLATFSRDLGKFKENGFVVEQVQPIDMFPQTPHIELMAVLNKG